MKVIFRGLDELLRGKRVGRGPGDDHKVEVPLGVFVPLAIGLGAIYGFFMGWYRVSEQWGKDSSAGYLQAFAAMVKMPALFVLTLLVTFPSLYVFSALLGGRLVFGSLMRLLVGTMVVSLAVAASFGPILGFFTLSTSNYSFIVVLNVVLLSISGLVGVGFLTRALRRLTGDVARPLGVPAAPGERLGPIFAVWIVIYGTVGTQMAWLLRPFIGHPDMPFEWIRPRSDNFIIGLLGNLRHLLGN
jgi:hypothetical protein